MNNDPLLFNKLNDAKIKLIIELIIGTISIFTAISLVNGFIYNYILLSYFDIDTSYYFQLNDYFESSPIGVIFNTLFAIFVCYNIFFKPHKETILNKAFSFTQNKLNISLNIFIVLFFLSNITAVYFTSVPIVPIIILYIFTLLPNLSSPNFRKFRHLAAFTALNIFLISNLSIFSIRNVIENTHNNTNPFEITLQDNKSLKQQGLFIISTNNNYVFCTTKKLKPYIIPRDNIISYSKPKTEFNPIKILFSNDVNRLLKNIR